MMKGSINERTFKRIDNVLYNGRIIKNFNSQSHSPRMYIETDYMHLNVTFDGAHALFSLGDGLSTLFADRPVASPEL